MSTISPRLARLIDALRQFPDARLHGVEKVVEILNCKHRFRLLRNDLMNEDWLTTFGDTLLIHHAFSQEPFTKDKFEHALVNSAKLLSITADFAPRGNRGHDITIHDEKFSLKTQADSAIRNDTIWISKYMELGRGDWSDQPNQLIALRDGFLEHLKASDRILILRCLSKEPNWRYELVEIPKSVLERSASGEFEMKQDSRQTPKPGYCRVYSASNELDFRLYFDGGGERKLQVQVLRKALCHVHAEWLFSPKESGLD